MVYPTLILWRGEQVRLTGDPYVVHLVETAYIVECLLSATLDEADEQCARAWGRILHPNAQRACQSVSRVFNSAHAARCVLLADSHQPGAGSRVG